MWPAVVKEHGRATRDRMVWRERVYAHSPAEVAALNAGDEARLAAMTGAEFFWVTADMAQVALDASHDLPAIVWDEVLPARAGWLGLAAPLPALSFPPIFPVPGTGDEEITGPIPVDAVSWSQDDGQVRVVAWCREARLPGTGRVQVGPLQALLRVTTDVNRERLPLAGAQVVDGDTGEIKASGDSLGLLAFLGATLTLMMQPTLVEASRRDPRTMGPAPDRPGRVPVVTLIDLRPLRQVAAESDESGRVYRHRWVVRGHWRNQAVGKGRAQRRPTWVASYVKGPADAPLLSTDKVMVWRR